MEEEVTPVDGNDNGWDLPTEADEVVGADE